jgi:hypothetical protein
MRNAPRIEAGWRDIAMIYDFRKEKNSQEAAWLNASP